MKVSIRFQLLIAIICVVIIAVVATSSLMYIEFNKIINKQITDNLENEMQERKKNIDNIISYIYEVGNYISVNDFVIRILNNEYSDVIENANSINAFRNEYKNMYRMLLKDKPGEFSFCFFANETLPVSDRLIANNLSKFNESLVEIYKDSEVKDKEWYKETVKKNGDLYTFKNEQNENYIFFAQAIKNSKNYNEEILGVTVIGMNFKQLLNNLEIMRSDNSVQYAVIDWDNHIIYKSRDTTEDYKILNILDNNTFNKGNELSVLTNVILDNQKHIVNICKFGFGVKMISIASEKTMRFTVNEVNKYVFICIILIFGVVVIISIILSGSLAHPIKRLSNVMENVNVNSNIKIQSKFPIASEIANLYVSFNIMTHRIASLVEEAKISGIRKKEAEIKMLQAQINPHFLYNALDTIAWMALIKNEDIIADMITALSDGFRYSVKEVDSFIRIEDEIEFIKGYIKLQELRCEGKFCFSVDITEKGNKFRIPKFIIQPLVENSIIHGIKQGGHQISIKVTVTHNEETVQIRVDDNGIGFDADKLNLYLNENKDIFHVEKSGIRNVSERIKLKFGDLYGIYYISNEDGGITAIITIPAVLN